MLKCFSFSLNNCLFSIYKNKSSNHKTMHDKHEIFTTTLFKICLFVTDVYKNILTFNGNDKEEEAIQKIIELSQ